MRMESLGVRRRKFCPADCTLETANQIQMRNIFCPSGFHKPHSDDFFQKQALPTLRLTPQPEHFARQCGVVSDACAVWFSRTKNALSTR